MNYLTEEDQKRLFDFVPWDIKNLHLIPDGKVIKVVIKNGGEYTGYYRAAPTPATTNVSGNRPALVAGGDEKIVLWLDHTEDTYYFVTDLLVEKPKPRKEVMGSTLKEGDTAWLHSQSYPDKEWYGTVMGRGLKHNLSPDGCKWATTYIDGSTLEIEDNGVEMTDDVNKEVISLVDIREGDELWVTINYGPQHHEDTTTYHGIVGKHPDFGDKAMLLKTIAPTRQNPLVNLEDYKGENPRRRDLKKIERRKKRALTVEEAKVLPADTEVTITLNQKVKNSFADNAYVSFGTASVSLRQLIEDYGATVVVSKEVKPRDLFTKDTMLRHKMVVSWAGSNPNRVMKFVYSRDFQTWTLTDDSYSFGDLKRKGWTTDSLLNKVGFDGMGGNLYIEERRD
jgi:hypothetical protein